MRRDILALTVSLLFLGVVLASSSRVVVKPEPEKKWPVVKDVRGKPMNETLSIQGNLTSGDRFRVYFTIVPMTPSGILSADAAVLIYLTDPKGHEEYYEVPIGSQGGQIGITKPLPEGVINNTGTYDVTAESYAGIALTYLALQKMELQEREPYYPYNFLLLPGIVLLLGGVGTHFLGAKILRRKKTRSKGLKHKT